MDYYANDMLDIQPLGQPFGIPWVGCLFIGSLEACEEFVERVTRRETEWQDKSFTSSTRTMTTSSRDSSATCTTRRHGRRRCARATGSRRWMREQHRNHQGTDPAGDPHRAGDHRKRARRVPDQKARRGELLGLRRKFSPV